MIPTPPKPVNESERLEALRLYEILDTEPEEKYDDITLLASHICQTPIALISLVDENRQWFKSKTGLSAEQTSRDIAFCSYAIMQDELMVVKDATKDTRFSENPLVISDPNIRFYAGAPLRTPENLAIGTLCVIDREPRELKPEQAEAMRALSRQVMTQLELRRILKERKNAEMKIIKLNSDLMNRAMELQQANEELEAFNRAVSHDLRNPLQSIIGYGQILRNLLDKQIDDKEGQYLDRILNNSWQMEKLIEALLNLSRVTRIELKSKEVDLSSIALEIITEFQIREPGRKVEILIADSILAEGDEGLLKVALQNLLSNAWKYTARSKSPRIEFGHYRNGDNKTVYFIRDNGVGFDIAKAKNLFMPFQRFHKKSDFQGTGVGLSTVKRIIERHNGKIWAEADVGKGTTFYFTLS